MGTPKAEVIDQVTNELRKAVSKLLTPQVNFDVGEVRRLDSATFGLFEVDEHTNQFLPLPTVLWTIEVCIEPDEDQS